LFFFQAIGLLKDLDIFFIFVQALEKYTYSSVSGQAKRQHDNDKKFNNNENNNDNSKLVWLFRTDKEK